MMAHTVNTINHCREINGWISSVQYMMCRLTASGISLSFWPSGNLYDDQICKCSSSTTILYIEKNDAYVCDCHNCMYVKMMYMYIFSYLLNAEGQLNMNQSQALAIGIRWAVSPISICQSHNYDHRLQQHIACIQAREVMHNLLQCVQ